MILGGNYKMAIETDESEGVEVQGDTTAENAVDDQIVKPDKENGDKHQSVAEAIRTAYAEKVAKEEKEGKAEKTSEDFTDPESPEKIEKAKGKAEKEESKEDEQELKYKPPVSWKKETHKVFKELPIEAQKVISEREKERESFLTRKSQEIQSAFKEVTEKVKPWQEIESKYVADAKMAKLSVPEIVEDMFSGLRAYRENPVAYIKSLAERRGIDLRALAQGDDEAAFDAEFNKAGYQNLQQATQIEELQNRINQLQSTLQQKDNEIKSESYYSYVDNWLTTKDTSVINELSDEDKSSFIGTFQALHSSLLQRHPNAQLDEILDSAWDQSVHAIPSIRKKIAFKNSARNIQGKLQHTQKVNGARPVSTSGSPVNMDSENKYKKGMSYHDIFSQAIKIRDS